jgi:hypothetical protein
MSLINDLSKLAGVQIKKTPKLKTESMEPDKDFSPEEMKFVRHAVVQTLKYLEREARNTQRSSLTKLYKQDADDYDHILELVMRGHRDAAKRAWANLDKGSKDHIFDVVKDSEARTVVAKYLGAKLLHESEQFLKESENKEFCVVLDATENSTFGDVYAEVTASQLKNIIIGTPKDKLRELSIFPISQKKQAQDLAQNRLHDSKPAPEDEEENVSPYDRGMKDALSGKPCPYEKGTNDEKEWKRGWDVSEGGRGVQAKKVHESEEPKVAFGKQDPEKLEYDAERGDGYAKAKTKGFKGTRKQWEEDRYFGGDEDEESGHLAGQKHLSSEPHPKNPHKVGTDEYTKWYIEYDNARHAKKESLDLETLNQLNEISKKTLSSYIKKAVDDVSYNSFTAGEMSPRNPARPKVDKKAFKRQAGIEKAVDKLTKESVNPKNHMGERTFQTFTGWKKACKQVNSEVWFDGDADIAQAMVGPKPYKRGETKSIGEWDGAEGSIYNLNENDEPKVSQLDDEQGDLEKQAETKPETEKVPSEVTKDLGEKIKEIKFKIEHLSHIDPTYQSQGYWVQFVIELEKIMDMLKLGTDEAFKEVATKLQTYENVALVEIPDSLWKFLSVDMYKSPEQRKSVPLAKRFREVKYGKVE